MRHVAGGDVAARGIDVVRRVVEEDVGAERLQERALVPPTEEPRLVLAFLIERRIAPPQKATLRVGGGAAVADDDQHGP